MAHEKNQELLKKLHDCLTHCEHCYSSCLNMDDVTMMAKCIATDRVCSDVCALTIQALARDCTYAPDFVKLCAKVCEDCGKECEKHDHDHCQACAKACFACAEACRAYAG